MLPHRLRFEFLGGSFEAATDDPRLLALLDRYFAPAPSLPSAGRRGRARFEARLAEPEPRLDGPGGTARLDRRDPLWHAYLLIVETVLGGVGSHFLLHASAVERTGRALLISAPSTFGKSTLCAHLVSRGYRFLADDIAALDRRTGRVEASARPINLRPGTRATLPPAAVLRAHAAIRRESGDEWLVDPERWLGPAPPPAVPAAVAILRPEWDGEDPRRFDRLELRFRSGREALVRELSVLPGVTAVEPRPNAPACLVASVVDPTEIELWLRAHRADVAWLRKFPSRGPDFDRAPEVRRLGTFQAAIELAQEMQNRHPGSRLDAEFGGQEALLVAELAERLRDASCFAVVPGRLDATVAALESMLPGLPL